MKKNKNKVIQDSFFEIVGIIILSTIMPIAIKAKETNTNQWISIPIILIILLIGVVVYSYGRDKIR